MVQASPLGHGLVVLHDTPWQAPLTHVLPLGHGLVLLQGNWYGSMRRG